jgi:hypothetical protein
MSDIQTAQLSVAEAADAIVALVEELDHVDFGEIEAKVPAIASTPEDRLVWGTPNDKGGHDAVALLSSYGYEVIEAVRPRVALALASPMTAMLVRRIRAEPPDTHWPMLLRPIWTTNFVSPHGLNCSVDPAQLKKIAGWQGKQAAKLGKARAKALIKSLSPQAQCKHTEWFYEVKNEQRFENEIKLWAKAFAPHVPDTVEALVAEIVRLRALRDLAKSETKKERFARLATKVRTPLEQIADALIVKSVGWYDNDEFYSRAITHRIQQLKREADKVFGKTRGLRVSRYFDWHRLASRNQKSHYRKYLGYSAYDDAHAPQFDHTTYFCKGSRPMMIVTQPYNFKLDHNARIAEFYGIKLEDLGMQTSWHSPGHVSLVVWTRE